MHVLIIGGTGLISTSITRKLLESKHRVTLFNRGKSESRIPPGAEVIHGDRFDIPAFEATFAKSTFDVVVDMFCFNPKDAEADVRAFSGRCGQFIFCSTVCVYSGPVTSIPTMESEPYHSIGEYGKNKARCEEVLFTAFRDQKFPATIIRPSHSYGEGGHLIRTFGPSDSFIDRLRKNKPLVVSGNGNSPWASLHVDDVASGFIAAMGNQKCLGEAYHICGDEWMSWNRYHEIIADVAGGQFEPVYIPWDVLRDHAPKWSCHEIFPWPSLFDMSKLKRDTNYSGQTISLREGVRRTIDWLDQTGRHRNSDEDVFEDELIAAWRQLRTGLPRQA